MGAALNLFLGGIPSIYYGQELGMTGVSQFGHWGMTDANEIPVREAFEWYQSDTGKGMALWYKNSGPWWDSTNLKPNDGISLEEEKADTNSLWHFYKKLIHLRRTNAALVNGRYKTITNNSDSVYSFMRITENLLAIIAVNLGSTTTTTHLNFIKSKKFNKTDVKQLLGNEFPEIKNNQWQLTLPPHAINLWQIDNHQKK